MHTAQHILTPIDFSDTSRDALQEADRLTADDLQAHLTLLHVHPVFEAALMDTSFVQPVETLTQMCEAIEGRLREWARSLKTPGERVTVRVITGSPVAEIVGASEKTDLIIMGTHGRTGVRHFLMGSVAERVVQGAHCSVLIVKKKPADSPLRPKNKEP